MEPDLAENESQQSEPEKRMSKPKIIALVLLGLAALFLIYHGLIWFRDEGLEMLLFVGGISALIFLARKYVVQSILIVIATLVVVYFMGYRLRPPVEFGFRKSDLGIGQVLQVKNTGSRELQCSMWVTNVTVMQCQTYDFILAPGEETEIGQQECGWIFDRGEYGNIYAKKHLFFRRFDVE